jgi:nitrite reductase (NADH) large subunit
VEGVTVRLGDPALALDLTARKVTTLDGALEYDTLVLATGSYPFVPAGAGPRPRPAASSTATLDDLQALTSFRPKERERRGGATGVVVGGGLLGLEAANALRRLGLTTTWSSWRRG